MFNRFEKDRIIDAEYEEILEPLYNNLADEDLTKEYDERCIQLKRCWISYTRTYGNQIKFHLYKLFDTVQDSILTFKEYIQYKIRSFKRMHRGLYLLLLYLFVTIVSLTIVRIGFALYDDYQCIKNPYCTVIKYL